MFVACEHTNSRNEYSMVSTAYVNFRRTNIRQRPFDAIASPSESPNRVYGLHCTSHKQHIILGKNDGDAIAVTVS
jgi:hypothetical protein